MAYASDPKLQILIFAFCGVLGIWLTHRYINRALKQLHVLRGQQKQLALVLSRLDVGLNLNPRLKDRIVNSLPLLFPLFGALLGVAIVMCSLFAALLALNF